MICSAQFRSGTTRRTREYDSLGQVTTGRTCWSDGSPVAGQQFEYAFDGIGNRTSTKAGGDGAGDGLRSADYTRNRLNQYSGRDVPGYADITGVANPTASVAVDGTAAYRKGDYFWYALPVNNTYASGPQYPEVQVRSLYGTNELNTGHIFMPTNRELFSYDADGNLTNDGRWAYSWDGENRLIRMQANTSVGPQKRLEFQYDWQGRRISKKVWPNTGGTGDPTNSVLFTYDGWNLLGVLASNRTPLTTFVWGLDLSSTLQGAGGVGGLLAVNPLATPASTHFACYDGNGNVVALANAADASVTARYEYGPFGELIRATGPMAKANPFRFSTKYQDDESDLLYYGYRHYNASTGRWIHRDPIGEEGGRNLLGFVCNDANNKCDSLGRNPISPEDPPGDNIDPPPSGPFSKCRTALSCHRAHADPTTIELPFDHCALVIDTGDGVYLLNGSGGSRNSRWVTPAPPGAETGPWTDNDPSVCECLLAHVKPWNDRNVPRHNLCENSNWNLKCSLKKCNVQLDWAGQQKPLGFNCRECAKTGSRINGDPTMSSTMCCLEWREKPCPDE